MVRSQSQKDRAKDKRIQSKFGITLADRDRRAEEQKQLCKICGGALDAFGPPALDHFHFKVKAFRATQPCPKDMKWYAQAYNELGHVAFLCRASTKARAIADTKKAAMPWSIRGLLCFKCNYGLGCIERFFDAARHPEILELVKSYLRARLDTIFTLTPYTDFDTIHEHSEREKTECPSQT
jgi:hypothetical protein